MHRLPQIAFLLLAAFAVAACANLNPISEAETPAQKGYAIERTYNIVLEQALEVARSRPELRSGIQAVEARTTPVVDALSRALTDYELARAQFAAGQTPAERLSTVALNLESWIAQAQAALLELSAAFQSEE